MMQFARMNVDAGLDAQRLLAVFFVRDHYIHMLDQFTHHFRCALAVLP